MRCASDATLEALDLTLAQFGVIEAFDNADHIHARVPGSLRIEPHQLRDVVAICHNGFARQIATRVLRQFPASRGNGEARGKAFDIPLEWGRERLIEIDDIEDRGAVYCRINTEICQVAVAAGLNPDATGGRGREICCHYRG